MRGATRGQGQPCPHKGISIHAPRAGCDSAAGAAASDRRHFNPRTPCGVRLGLYVTVSRSGSYFNPRTPCGVRHEVIFNKPRNKDTFQSTHPVRGATQRDLYYQTKQQISIHAPRAGCDAGGISCTAATSHFNPRTPCGVRRGRGVLPRAGQNFNPRTPCGVRRRRSTARTI